MKRRLLLFLAGLAMIGILTLSHGATLTFINQDISPQSNISLAPVNWTVYPWPKEAGAACNNSNKTPPGLKSVWNSNRCPLADGQKAYLISQSLGNANQTPAWCWTGKEDVTITLQNDGQYNLAGNGIYYTYNTNCS